MRFGTVCTSIVSVCHSSTRSAPKRHGLTQFDNDWDTFQTRFDMLSDMDFILRFSKKYKFDCVQEPLAIYRQHEDQLQNKNIDKQVTQMSEWYEKIKLSKEFGPDEKLEMIKNRCKFFKIVKYINEKFYIKSLKEIVFYPNSIDRIKLFLMLIIPKKIFNRIISLR